MQAVGEFSRQQDMQLCMMDALTLPRQKITETRCTHHAEEEVGKVPGGHDAAGKNSSMVEGDGTGNGLDTPALALEGSSMQAEACEVGCDSDDGQVSETPGWPLPSAAADDHIWEGYSAALGMAAVVAVMLLTTAAAKAADEGDSEIMGDGRGMAPEVPLASWSNVEGQAGSTDAIQKGAAESADSVVGGV